MPLKLMNLPPANNEDAPRTIAAPRATAGQYVAAIVLLLLGTALCGYAYYIW